MEETNQFSSELQEKMIPGVQGKMARWVSTTIKEMCSFLVAILLMGVRRKPSLRDYWSTDPLLQNRRGMPVCLGRMTKGQVECRQNGTQLDVKWHDKRDVLILVRGRSSLTVSLNTTKYNKKTVNRADMVKGFLEWKTTKWYKKIFFYLLDTAVLNSHIVHRQLSG